MALAGEAGLASERIILLGFSQGACLALEYAARHPLRYGGVVGLSGGLIGPDGPRSACPGSMDGTPVFLGCSDRDPHIPQHRVEEAHRYFNACGAKAAMRIYPGMGHTINEDEIAQVRQLMGLLNS